MRRLLYLVLIYSMSWCHLEAQVYKGVKLTLKECEDSFFKNNLSLLASNYNVTMQQALVLQARIWENPYVSAEFNFIDPQDKKLFSVGGDGQKVFAIQQLIYLGNKKKKEVSVAQSNAKLSALQYEDLLRNLKYELRKSFFSVYYDNFTLEALSSQLTNLDTLISAYIVQAGKGNIPLKDVARLQSLFIKLKNERTELYNNVSEELKNLSLITGIDTLITPVPNQLELTKYDKKLQINIDSLVNLSLLNRPDFHYALESVMGAKENLKWQKALGIPDLTLGLNYDQNGGAFKNQINMTLGIPLRIKNTNKGNIEMAKANVLFTQTEKDQKILELKSEVKSIYFRYKDASSNFSADNFAFRQNLDEINKGVFSNFQKRNISLLEFTDFVESYNDSINEFNRLKKNLTLLSEEINLVSASNIF